MPIHENVQRVLSGIGESASRVGRDPSEITLVAVSKTRSVHEIEEALEAGVLHVGENRVQEASLKIPVVSGKSIWHMVGRLQSNKGKAAVGLFDWIDSVHSKKIIDIISATASQERKTVNILIQVNISGEESKSGVAVDEVKDLVLYAAGKERIAVQGLMTIGSFGVTPEVTRSEFSRMKEFFDRVKEDRETASFMKVLSMGMSGDYTIAIEEGSTMVRVGTAVFGQRN